MSEEEKFRRATELWQEAYRAQMQGELDRAIELYQRSIDVYPTAEAHTFLGWTFEGAVRAAPDDIHAHKALHSLRARLN